MRQSPRLIAALLVFASLSAPVGASAPESASLALAIDYLLSSQQRSGFLLYGYDFLEDAEVEPGRMSALQLTRQAGSAAVLADAFALTRAPRLADAASRLLDLLGKYSLPIGRSRLQSLIAETRIQSIPAGRWRIESALKRHRLLYETSGPGLLVCPDSNYANAYAGATALALLTELRYAQATGDQRFAVLRRGWLKGLIALRIPGDGFRQIPDSMDTHPYYDAEPWMALAEYHHVFPADAEVNSVLAEVDDALMHKYGAKFALEFYHWGMMAAARRYADTREQRYLGFVRVQTTEFLNRMEHVQDNDNNCAAVEGVADTLGALQLAGEKDGALYRRARAWASAEMRKAWRMQIKPGQTELLFANARIVAPRMQEFEGAFRNGLYTAATLVDSTGHCLSAMVKLKRHGIALGP